jgi:UDP-2-acetamido-3-amino-2,3-dideoxy-glucuronate N-acetyltransferase
MDAPYMKVSDNVKIGKNVRFSGFCNLYGCEIGDESSIGPFVEIQKGVRIGRNVKLQSHTFICTGVTIGDEAFIGHGVMFINDKYPMSTTGDGHRKTEDDWECVQTVVERRASIGSNATILCGLTIGENSVVGAGSVVTKNVPARAIVAGNPARFIRFKE